MPNMKDFHKIRMNAVKDFVGVFRNYFDPQIMIVGSNRSGRIVADEFYCRMN